MVGVDKKNYNRVPPEHLTLPYTYTNAAGFTKSKLDNRNSYTNYWRGQTQASAMAAGIVSLLSPKGEAFFPKALPKVLGSSRDFGQVMFELDLAARSGTENQRKLAYLRERPDHPLTRRMV